jgi:uncharacterized repeat protein (TIGR02543 family)
MRKFSIQMARFKRTAVLFIAATLIFALAACSNPSGTEQYTITFDSQGGSAVDPITADEGAQVPEPAPAPTKADFEFAGWHSAASGGTLYTWPHTLTANVTMYARWEETVVITGAAQVGQALTADTSNLGGSGTISYQWQRGDSAAGTFANIEDATDSSYTLTTADLNKYIRVTVSRADNTGAVSSAAVGPVAAIPTSSITIGFNYGAISITGSDGANIIYKSSSTPASVTLSAAGYSDVKWYVDGDSSAAGTGNSITLNAADYSAKTHSITFTGTIGGALYSQELPFTVKN